MSIKIIVADDHKLFLDGLMLILGEMPEAEVVARASNGKEVLRSLHSHRATLLLLDINMPVLNGLDTLREVKKLHPGLKVLILSMHYEKYMVRQVMQDGADGYLIKTSDKEEFKTAIRRVSGGGVYFSSELTSQLLAAPVSEHANKTSLLSRREVEIIALLADGLGSQEIGKKAGISPRTVDTHRNNILQKLELRNTAELISFAFRNDLLDKDKA